MVCFATSLFSVCLTNFSFTPLLLTIKFHKPFLASGSLRLLTICSFHMIIIIIIIILFNKSVLVTHRVHANRKICLSTTQRSQDAMPKNRSEILQRWTQTGHFRNPSIYIPNLNHTLAYLHVLEKQINDVQMLQKHSAYPQWIKCSLFCCNSQLLVLFQQHFPHCQSRLGELCLLMPMLQIKREKCSQTAGTPSKHSARLLIQKPVPLLNDWLLD